MWRVGFQEEPAALSLDSMGWSHRGEEGKTAPVLVIRTLYFGVLDLSGSDLLGTILVPSNPRRRIPQTVLDLSHALLSLLSLFFPCLAPSLIVIPLSNSLVWHAPVIVAAKRPYPVYGGSALSLFASPAKNPELQISLLQFKNLRPRHQLTTSPSSHLCYLCSVSSITYI